MFAILLIIFLKDSSKIVLPQVIYKPLYALEALTEKPVTPFLAIAILLSENQNELFSETSVIVF